MVPVLSWQLDPHFLFLSGRGSIRVYPTTVTRLLCRGAELQTNLQRVVSKEGPHWYVSLLQIMYQNMLLALATVAPQRPARPLPARRNRDRPP